MISEAPETAVIFCKTKENVDKVFENLNKKGYSVNKIHGGMLQKDRLDAVSYTHLWTYENRIWSWKIFRRAI